MIKRRVVRLLGNASLALGRVDIVFGRYDNGVSIKTWSVSFAYTIPRYHILGSSPVPNYRMFLKGIDNKANLTNYISNYIVDNAGEHIPNRKSIILAGGSA